MIMYRCMRTVDRNKHHKTKKNYTIRHGGPAVQNQSYTKIDIEHKSYEIGKTPFPATNMDGKNLLPTFL